jgi:fructose-bisphosphate aldolase class 1
MESTGASLLECGKGILAADESLSTIGKRFAALPCGELTHRI